MTWYANNLTEIALEGMWTNGRPIVNVWHYYREEQSPEESVRDVLDNWQDHIVGGILVNNYTITGASWRDRNTLDGLTGFELADPGKPTTGVEAEASGPPDDAYLVHKNIPTTATHRRGRCFVAGVREGSVDENGVVSAPVQASVNAAFALFLSGLTGTGGSQLQVVHLPPLGVGEADTTTIQSLTCDPVIANQRRRVRG